MEGHTPEGRAKLYVAAILSGQLNYIAAIDSQMLRLTY
jgi:hypothetical protein